MLTLSVGRQEGHLTCEKFRISSLGWKTPADWGAAWRWDDRDHADSEGIPAGMEAGVAAFPGMETDVGIQQGWKQVLWDSFGDVKEIPN